MILVDTSVWIEFFKGNEPYSFQLSTLMDNQELITCEPIFAELMQGAKGKREREVLMAYWGALLKPSAENLLIESALRASKENHINKGVGLIDSVLVHLVKTMDLKLWTLDKKLSKLLKVSEKFEAIKL